jgi:hypothetical protein
VTRARRVLCLGLVGACGPAIVRAQQLDLTLPHARFTVGDPIDIPLSIRLPAHAELIDRTPHALEALPPDLTVLAVDTIRRSGDGYAGRIRLRVLRAGLQNLPEFFVRYRVATDTTPDTLVSRPLPIEIVSVLPPGPVEPKDVYGLEPVPGGGVSPVWPALIATAVAVGFLVLRRRRIRLPVPVAPASPVVPAPSDPYQIALARLAEVEAARWPARGAVDRHYDLVTDVLRRYLEEATGIEALERTTAELMRVLPTALATIDGCRALLAEADLVKFARARPDDARAGDYLSAIRTLLNRWHNALQGPNAIR